MRYLLLVLLLGFATQAFAEEIPTIAPYELIKNPFLFKNKKIILNPITHFITVNQLVPSMRFKKMLDEKEAIYEVYDREYSYHTYPEYMGEILVVFPDAPNTRESDGPLSYHSMWEVEPLGQIEGTNAFGGTISKPAIKFLGYVSETKPSNTVEINIFGYSNFGLISNTKSLIR